MLSISGISKNPVAFKQQTYSQPTAVYDVEYEEVNDEFNKQPQATKEYTEDDYNEDKAFLEKTQHDIEAIIENVNPPKPIKTLGKVVLGCISVAMGFMSMRWGTLASWKVAENIVTNPKAQKIASGMTSPITGAYKSVATTIKSSEAGQKLAEKIGTKLNKLKETPIGQAINDFMTKSGEKIGKLTAPLNEKAKAASITTERVKNFTANFFGTSGGVTAGVEAIQANSSESNQAA